MEQELEKENLSSTVTEQEVKTSMPSLESLPRLEDLLKSENEIKASQKTTLEGLTAVKAETKAQDRTFARVEDQKKTFVKRRIKTITAVFGVAASLILAFVGFNLITLANLSKDIKTNTKTIQSQTEIVQNYIENNPAAVPPTGSFEISLNEPRDYDDDKKELSMLDKITILFRNLFG